jgi:hypothetical protein
MSSELEQRLERLLSSHPQSTGSVEEQAREAALSTIPASARSRYRPAAWMVVLAAVTGLVVTGVALAASPSSFRDLRDVVYPTSPKATPASKHRGAVVRVPPGAAGFTVQSGNRLWVAKPDRIALRGVPLADAATSPSALYAVGQDAGRLKAVSVADRHVAWSVPLHGKLAAAAWSPYPIRVAYVVRRRGRGVLHLIWGNGANDQIVGPATAVMPAWRSDSLALAYVSPTGTVLVRTIGRAAPQRLNTAATCGAQRITELAFSPSSATLAEATDTSAVILTDILHPGKATCIHTGTRATDLRWLSPTTLLFSHHGSDQLTLIAASRGHVAARGTLIAPGPILAAATSPDGRHIAIAILHGDQLRILTSRPPRLGTTALLRAVDELSVAPPASRMVRIGWS